jgi:hypothetical protein
MCRLAPRLTSGTVVIPEGTFGLVIPFMRAPRMNVK